MIKLATAVGAFALVVLCSSAGWAQFAASETSVLGTWEVDLLAALPADADPMAAAMLADSRLTLTVNPDGTMVMTSVMMGETQSSNATWTIASVEGATVTMTVVSAQAEPSTGVWSFSDADNAVITGDGETIIVARASEAAPEAAQETTREIAPDPQTAPPTTP